MFAKCHFYSHVYRNKHEMINVAVQPHNTNTTRQVIFKISGNIIEN